MFLIPRTLRRFRKTVFGLLLVALTCTWVGCENLRYYNQAINGQYQIVAGKRPINEVIADEKTPADLKQKLQRIVAIREYAQKELHLPANGQYNQYADVHRRFVVWNVYAAPEFSLEPKAWNFPIVGKATYRGYFSEKAARDYAEKLKKEGYDVHVGGVEAYSTVGWFRDPVLNTFVNNADVDLAETLFHELAHQTAFAKGDTDFNEAFATAVAEEGLRRWMLSNTNSAGLENYRAELQHKEQFLRLIMDTRDELARLYEDHTPTNTQIASLGGASDWTDKRLRKQQIITQLRDDYEKLKVSWGGKGEYDGWFSKPINNAKLGTVATYYELVPAFNHLLTQKNGDLPALYQEVRKIAKLSKKERRAVLDDLLRAGNPQVAGK